MSTSVVSIKQIFYHPKLHRKERENWLFNKRDSALACDSRNPNKENAD